MRTEDKESDCQCLTDKVKDHEFLSDDLGKHGRMLIQRDRKPDLLLFLCLSPSACAFLGGLGAN